jgi:uncharacterized protein YaiI (UPF0178 family)
MVTLYIDADACPVKDEVYKVALRYQAPVFVVSNSWIRTPALKLISRSWSTRGRTSPTTGLPSAPMQAPSS